MTIDPKKCFKAIVSPRQRALRTFHLLFTHTEEPPYEVSDNAREWDYGKFEQYPCCRINVLYLGDYEGLTKAEIFETNPTWTVWKDG